MPHIYCIFVFLTLGSLPPSPADSGVSDVDPSSSSHNSDDERMHIRQQRNSGSLYYLYIAENYFVPWINTYYASAYIAVETTTSDHKRVAMS